MPLYHVEVYWPKNVRCPKGVHFLKYSRHAQEAAQSDRYGHIELPPYIDIDKAEPIEMEVENNQIKKILYRINLTNLLDMCLVIIPNEWFVKTVWINERWDKHRTLNKGKYSRG